MPTPVIREGESHAGRSLLWLGLLALVPLMCAPRSTGAQPTVPVRVWSQIGSVLKADMPLRVTTRSAVDSASSTMQGALISVTNDALFIRRDGASDRIASNLITRIERSDARSRRVWRRGVPLGALAGGLITMLIDAQSSNPEPVQAFGMGAVLIGMPVGAITAAALPVQPLYLAPSLR